MALSAAVSLTSGSDLTDQTTAYSTASITPTNGRLILCAVLAREGTSCPTPTVTQNGHTWTFRGKVDIATGTAVRGFLFSHVEADSGAGAASIDFGGASMTRCAWSICEIPGVNTAGAVVQVVLNDGGTGLTAVGVTLAALQDTLNGVYGAHFLSGAGSNKAITPETGYTEVHEVQMAGSGSDVGTLETIFRTDNDTTPGVTWTGGINAGALGIEVRESSVAIPGFPAGIGHRGGLIGASGELIGSGGRLIG